MGQGIAGMIEDYGIDGKDISGRTILEVLGILANGAQMGAYGNAFANGFAGAAGVAGSEGKSESGSKTGSRFPENPNDLFPKNYAGLEKEVKPDGKINYVVQAGHKTYKIEYHPQHEGEGHYDGNHYHILKLGEYPKPGKTKPPYFRIPNLDPDTPAKGGTFAPGDLLPTKNNR